MQTTKPEIKEGDQLRFLSFFLGEEEFAIPILRVREIIRYQPVTPIPNMPRFIRGVINLRGAVVPIFDVSAKFRLALREPTPRSCFVITESGKKGEELIMGLLVDSVSHVRTFPDAEIEPVPHFGTMVEEKYLRGMGKLGEKFVMLINLDLLFDDEIAAAAHYEMNDQASPTEPLKGK